LVLEPGLKIFLVALGSEHDVLLLCDCGDF